MDIQLGKLKGTLVRPDEERGPPVLLVHGLGMGRWVFERFQATLAGQGVPSIAIDLPGHGGEDESEPGFERAVAEVTEAVDELPGCVLLGHSGGGAIAQVAAGRARPTALILVQPFPCDGVAMPTHRFMLHLARRHLTDLLMGRPVVFEAEDLERMGLDLVPEAQRAALADKFQPVPARLLRQLVRRPYRVDPGAVRCPTLVCTGKLDAVTPWVVGRRIGEWYDAVIWRYDDLGHFPWLQDEGVRLENQLAEYIVRPVERKVTEAEAWAPNEGRGTDARMVSRGSEGARRSAYGQRMGRQGGSATEQWDQNVTSLNGAGPS